MLKKILIASLVYIGLAYTQKALDPVDFVSPDAMAQESIQINPVGEEMVEVDPVTEEAIEIDQQPLINDNSGRFGGGLYDIKAALNKADIAALKQKLSEIRLTDKQLQEITRHAQAVIKKTKMELTLLSRALLTIKDNQKKAQTTMLEKLAGFSAIRRIYALQDKLVRAGQCLEIVLSTGSTGEEQEQHIIAPDVDAINTSTEEVVPLAETTPSADKMGVYEQ